MQLKDRKSCPLCNNQNFISKVNSSFEPNNLKTNNFKITDNEYGKCWNFYQCNHCEFVFSNPFLDEHSLTEFYSKLEDKEYSEEAKGREKNFVKILKRLEKIQKPGQELLDIGAASGIFLNIATQFGYSINGVEPSDSLVKQAMELYKIHIFHGTIELFPKKTQYSVITLLDILEHLPNPDDFLTHTDKHLKEDGVLVIVTPDINSFTARIMKKKWWHYRIAHVNFFNIKSIEFLLEKHNFTILKKKRFAWNFSLYYLLSRIIPFKEKKKSTLQKILKNINLKIQLFDSWEIYARKNKTLS